MNLFDNFLLFLIFFSSLVFVSFLSFITIFHHTAHCIHHLRLSLSTTSNHCYQWPPWGRGHYCQPNLKAIITFGPMSLVTNFNHHLLQPPSELQWLLPRRPTFVIRPSHFHQFQIYKNKSKLKQYINMLLNEKFWTNSKLSRHLPN